MSKTLRKRLELECDHLFSMIIRKRFADENERVGCGTCTTYTHWNQLTCGHFRKRRHMATRWHLKNAGPQCSFCNGADEDMSDYISAHFGKETVEELIQLSHKDVHYSIEQLQEKIEELKALL